MKNIRPLLSLLSLILSTLVLVSCFSVKAKAAINLSLLSGIWEGSYEYLDYQGDAERIQLPTTVIISVDSNDGGVGPAEARFEILYRQPDGADVSEDLTLRYFPVESLVEYDGTWAVTEAIDDAQQDFLRLVFTGNGEDDDRTALVRQSIERLGESLILRKEVRYDDATDFIVRTEYLLHQSN